MITPASRFLLGISLFALAAGIAHAAGSDTELYGILLFAGLLVAAFFLGVAVIANRDGEVAPDSAAAVLAPSPAQPMPPSAWPAVAAAGAGFAALGVAAGFGYLALGVALVGVGVLEWAAQSWSEQLSADPAHNRAERNRIMLPFEIPVGVTAIAGAVAIAISRLLLAVSATGAVVAAAVLAAVVLAVATVIALQPRLPSWVLGAVAVLGAVTVAAFGLIGVGVGEREFHHEEGAGHGAAEEQEEGDAVSEVPREATLVAADISFDQEEITLAAGLEVTIHLENDDDGIPHNLAVLDDDEVLAATEIEAGPVSQTLELTIEERGVYTFICQVHPSQMVGDLVMS